MNLISSIAEQLGITDQVTVCGCCDKSGLKRTVVFKTSDEWRDAGGDDFVYLGTTCATKIGRGAIIKRIVNANGLTQSEQEQADEAASIRISYARRLVSMGWTLRTAWAEVRRIEDAGNGLYKMSQAIAIDAALKAHTI
jgi:hypothetical protein